MYVYHSKHMTRERPCRNVSRNHRCYSSSPGGASQLVKSAQSALQRRCLPAQPSAPGA